LHTIAGAHLVSPQEVIDTDALGLLRSRTNVNVTFLDELIPLYVLTVDKVSRIGMLEHGLATVRIRNGRDAESDLISDMILEQGRGDELLKTCNIGDGRSDEGRGLDDTE